MFRFFQESEFYVSNYYKGQRLTGDLGSLDTATWLKSSRIYSSMTVTRYPERRITLTVEEVTSLQPVLLLYVYFQLCYIVLFKYVHVCV